MSTSLRDVQPDFAIDFAGQSSSGQARSVRLKLYGQHLTMIDGARHVQVHRVSFQSATDVGFIILVESALIVVPIWRLEALLDVFAKACVHHDIPAVPSTKESFLVCDETPWHHGPDKPSRTVLMGSTLYATPWCGWLKIEAYYLPLSSSSLKLPPQRGAYQSLCSGSGCMIPKAEERGITMHQLQMIKQYIDVHCVAEAWVDHSPTSPTHGCTLQPWHINLYQVVQHIVLPATHVEDRRCSFVEFVADAPQSPNWYTSHWWGEPVMQFILCVQGHAALRQLPSTSSYWVCGCANCQWDLSGIQEESLEATTFYKAMSLADGIVCILDPEAVALSRIWCCYEAAVTLMSAGEKLYDIATSMDGSSIIITDGLAVEDEAQGADVSWLHRGGPYGHKLDREKTFPEHLFAKGVAVRLEKGCASFPQDRQRILNAIAGRSRTAPVVDTHPNYEELNSLLRWRFAVAVFHLAAEKGLINENGFQAHLIHEPQKVDLAFVYENLAKALQVTEKWNLEVLVRRRLCFLAKSTFGDGHPSVISSMRDLATCLQAMQRSHEAMQLHEEVLAARENRLSRVHPDTLDSFRDLGDIYEGLGRIEDALRLRIIERDGRERTFGLNHHSTATCYNRLGLTHQARGDMDSALAAFERALLVADRHQGEYQVCTVLQNIACVYKSRNMYCDAEQMYREALEIRKQALGYDHPETLDSIMMLARTLEDMGRADEAAQLYRLALECRERILGGEHPATLRTRDDLRRLNH